MEKGNEFPHTRIKKGDWKISEVKEKSIFLTMGNFVSVKVWVERVRERVKLRCRIYSYE